MLLRHNTGYEDGKFSLIAGHVETNESAVQAIVREAKEEAGIEIEPANIKVKHIMHRKTDRENVDIFFSCSNYNGTIANIEPHKCAELSFYESEKLPKNMIPYITDALMAISKGAIYSEFGW